MPTNRQAIISSEDTIIEYIKDFNKGKLFLFSGAYVGSKLANYLLTLKPREEAIDEKVVQYWMGVLRNSRMYYFGAHTTIHIDSEGKLMDWYERLSAIARSGIVDRRHMPMVNLHFGILPFLRPHMRSSEYPRPPLSVYTADALVPVEFIKVEAPVVKEPEYAAKYSPKTIVLIMAIQAGDINLKYNRKQAAVWEKENDSPLLEECLQEGERLSKVSARFLTATEWGALRYVTAVNHEDESSVFFTLIQAETRLKPTHPISKLRHQFGVSSNHVARDYTYRMALVATAWSYYINKDELTAQWEKVVKPEEFPQIQ